LGDKGAAVIGALTVFRVYEDIIGTTFALLSNTSYSSVSSISKYSLFFTGGLGEPLVLLAAAVKAGYIS
jgi:predicted membrane protein